MARRSTERSIVTGKKSAELGMRNAELCPEGSFVSRVRQFVRFLIPQSALRIQKGFSLLELMISMFILIILLSIAVPTYQRSMRFARETVLKENLWQMRRAIDQYTGDKGKLPAGIDALVEAKYLYERPIDPVMNNTEWKEIMGEDTNTTDGSQGLKDVKTMADGEDSEGVAFSEY